MRSSHSHRHRCKIPVLIIPRFCKSRQPQPQTLTTQSLKLTEERITQGHRLNPPHLRITRKLRIDEKEDRHIHRLPRRQPLLLEAKTLDLAEVRRHLPGTDAVGRHPDDVFGRGVGGGVEREGGFSGQDPHFALLRREFPGEDVGDGGVEGDAQAGGGGDGGEAGGGGGVGG